MANFGQDLYNMLIGSQGQFREAPSAYNPQQQGFFNQAGQMGIQGLGTDAIEGLARRGYQQQTIPLLSERFANIGGRGLSGIGSSGYQNALISQGSDLEAQLAALRQGNSMDLLRLGLTPQKEHYFEPGQQGILGDLLKQGARAGLAYATGGASEAGNIMNLFQSYLNGGGQGQNQPETNQQQAQRPGILQALNMSYKPALQAAGLPGIQSQQAMMPSSDQVNQTLKTGSQFQKMDLFNRLGLGSSINRASKYQNIYSQLQQPMPQFEL